MQWPWTILSDLGNFLTTRSIAQSLGDSWASCTCQLSLRLTTIVTSDHVWSDWKSDHELSTEAIRRKPLNVHWLDDWSMEWRRRKERIVVLVRWRVLQRLPVSTTKIETARDLVYLRFSLLLTISIPVVLWIKMFIGFCRRSYANLCEAPSACCLLQRCCCDPLSKCWIQIKTTPVTHTVEF